MICLEVGVKLVAASVKEGAKILIGGKQIESRGYFHRPIILKNVTPKNAYRKNVKSYLLVSRFFMPYITTTMFLLMIVGLFH